MFQRFMSCSSLSQNNTPNAVSAIEDLRHPGEFTKPLASNSAASTAVDVVKTPSCSSNPGRHATRAEEPPAKKACIQGRSGGAVAENCKVAAGSARPVQSPSASVHSVWNPVEKAARPSDERRLSSGGGGSNVSESEAAGETICV